MEHTESIDRYNLRFVDNERCKSKRQERFEDFKTHRLVSLDEAIQPLIDIVVGIQEMVSIIKNKCQNPKDGLSVDQSAAIMLYTYESKVHENSLYFILNQTLRFQQKQALKRWLPYLRLITHALDLLPSKTCHIYRGVRANLTSVYPVGDTSVCWSFTSCTSNISVLKNTFLGTVGNRTILHIDCHDGKDIRNHSCVPDENEILLLPNAEFFIRDHLNPADGFFMIQIEEVPQPIPLHKQSVWCKEHSNRKIEYWCHEENELVCADCLLFNHKNHHYENASSFSRSKSKQLFDEANILRLLITEQRNKLESATSHFTEQRSSITNTFRQLHELLNNYEQRIQREIQTLADKNKIEVDKYLEQLVTLETHLDSQINLFNDINSTKNPVYIIQNTDCFEKSIEVLNQNLTKIDVPNISEIHPTQIDHICDDISKRLDSICINVASEIPNLPENAKWSSQATIYVEHIDQPWGITIDKSTNTLFVVEHGKHRIRKFGNDEKVIAGGDKPGTALDQLNSPTDILFDRKSQSIFVCDTGNKRVMRWRLRDKTRKGEVVLRNIVSSGLALDHDGVLHVSDINKNEVRKYPEGNSVGILVAGGHGKGDKLNQLDCPLFIAVDNDDSVYVSDWNNHRVVKWLKGAQEGIVVAGGNGQGTQLSQLSHPQSLVIDNNGTIYIVEATNNCVTRWYAGDTIGEVIMGAKNPAYHVDLFRSPMGLCMDTTGHFYVTDSKNNRVLRFVLLS